MQFLCKSTYILYLNVIHTNSHQSQSCSKYQNSMQSGTDDIRQQTDKYKWPYNTLRDQITSYLLIDENCSM